MVHTGTIGPSIGLWVYLEGSPFDAWVIPSRESHINFAPRNPGMIISSKQTKPNNQTNKQTNQQTNKETIHGFKLLWKSMMMMMMMMTMTMMMMMMMMMMMKMMMMVMMRMVSMLYQQTRKDKIEYDDDDSLTSLQDLVTMPCHGFAFSLFGFRVESQVLAAPLRRSREALGLQAPDEAPRPPAPGAPGAPPPPPPPRVRKEIQETRRCSVD